MAVELLGGLLAGSSSLSDLLGRLSYWEAPWLELKIAVRHVFKHFVNFPLFTSI
jgi:hypothetical protein